MICVYPPDSTDFSNNGLGAVCPQSCQVTETLNGEWELTLVHPLDDAGKWLRLQEGYILRAPVPAAITPAISMPDSAAIVEREVWRVRITTSGAGGYSRIYAKPSTSSKVLQKLRNGEEYEYLGKHNGSWHKAVSADGVSGYMWTANSEYTRTESVPINQSGVTVHSTVIESRQLRDQPFRIYRVVPDLEKITVYARHVFYDLMDNMIQKYAPQDSDTGAAVVAALSEKCLSEHDFTFYSDLDSTAEEVSFENVNPIDAILGEGGVVEKYATELARDWFDVFLVRRVGSDTNVQIREGKNLLGVSYDVDQTNVVTRIMPTGEDKDGNVLYLPELFLDSPNIGTYPHPRWIHLAVSEAKEVTSGDDKKNKDQCYQDMRKAAQAQLDAGCDLPDVTLSVDFINCADTVEYAQYAALQNIFLGDAVRVIAPRIGVAVSMRMTQYTYDCLLKKYTAMTLGTVADTVEGNVISARQLPSGIITGAKLAINSVGAGQLQNGSVNSLHVQLAAIDTAHIRDAAIKNAQIENAAITSAKIGDAQITTAKIEDLAVTKAKIAEAAIGSAQIENASITNAKIKDAAITTAKIEDAAITSAKIGSGEIQEAHIENGAITNAKIHDAAIDTAKIANAAIGTAQIADAAITNAKIGAAAVGTAHIQDGSIGTAKIVDAAITRAKIANLAVGSAQIDDLAVTTAKIAQAAITNAQIENAAIDTAKIALGAITAALIEQGAVGTAQIADGSITDAKIVSLSANRITAGVLSVERLIIRGNEQSLVYAINNMGELVSTQCDTIDGYVLTERTVTADKIVARSITAAEIASKTITANEILAGTITGNEIAGSTITGANVLAGTLTTSHVSSDFGEKLDLSSNEGVNLTVRDLDDRLSAQIRNMGDSIQTEVRNNYVSASSMRTLEQQVQTLAEQTDRNFTWTVAEFDTLKTSVDGELQDFQEYRRQLQTYMTFGQDGLTIGKTGNPFTFRVVNDRLAFYMNNTEVAYLSNNKLYVTNAEILQSMKIGRFSFEPQTNGNLSLVYTG